MNKKISYKDFSRSFLEDIQGNILRSHNRIHARHLFISLGNNKKANKSVRAWIQDLAYQYITSTWHDIDFNLSEKSIFCSLLLSHSGYLKLGQTAPNDLAFQLGMKQRKNLLHDPDTTAWEKSYSKKSIDAMIIIADNDPVKVAVETVKIKELFLSAGGAVLIEEQGHRLKRENQEIEHFGFVDGISQPEETKTKIKNSDKDILVTDPKALLVSDPYGGYGSYLVYRKLEQNVKVWEDNVKALAVVTDSNPFLTGAWAIGRFKDGTPVTKYDEMQHQSEPDNNFNYSQDPKGDRCPFHGHTRKMNNRNENNYPRITRRAMSYGLRPDLHPQGKMFALPEIGVGLLFMCYQNNIEQGFEYLQQEANNPDTPHINAGMDPLISQGRESTISNTWPTSHNDSNRVHFDFDRTITLKGGEYFFAPSIGFLRDIK